MSCLLPRGNIQREAENVAGVRILGIGEADCLWELGPWPNSLSNPTPLIPSPKTQNQNPKTLNSKA